MAYEWGLRHSATPSVVIGKIPMSVAEDLIKSQRLQIPYFEGQSVPQLVFRQVPSSP